jgi:hypothetical protein
MKLLTGMTVVSVLAIVCMGLLPPGLAEVRIQLQGEGMAIYGTVMVPGTRQPMPGTRIGLAGDGRNSRPGDLWDEPEEEQVIATADAQGRFGFMGLAPGEYVLYAVPRPPRRSSESG